MSKKDRVSDKIKKKREREQKQLLSMSQEELVQEGDSLFANGNTREAIKFYQMALKTDRVATLTLSAASNKNITDQIKEKLFVAYSARVKELRDKKMFSEAKSMESQALAFISDPLSLANHNIGLFLKLCSPEKAFSIYNQFYRKNGSSSSLERVLAEKLIKLRCWDIVSILDTEISIAKDAPLVKHAATLMDSGDWDAALESMKSISRSSSFAHIRLFCKAMSAFYRDNDSEMLKAISMIPSDSIFIKITNVLKRNAGNHLIHKESGSNDEDELKINGEKGVSKGNNFDTSYNIELSILKSLWSGPFEIKDKIKNIIELGKKSNYNDLLQKNILEFAKLIMPAHSESVVQFVLETMYNSDVINDSKFIRMAEKLLRQKAYLFKAKVDAVFIRELFSSTLAYFEYLHKEFSDTEEQNMVKSMLICKLASYFIANSDYGEVRRATREDANALKLLGITSSEPVVAILEMIDFGITIDPENIELYEIALKVPSLEKEVKNLKEKIITSKCRTFPDDPEPLLKLASIFYSKNAYRKAETTLQKALEIAPHDSRVMEQHVISLLNSADKSAGKKKFHLCYQDIQKAKQFELKKCDIFIAEKSIFYKVAETGHITEDEINAELKTFSLCDRLKCYALLIGDIEEKLGFGNPASLKSFFDNANYTKIDKEKDSLFKLEVNKSDPYSLIFSLFRTDLSDIKELTSWDVLNLLLPLPAEWKKLYSRIELIKYFADNSKKEVFAKLEDSELLTLIDKIEDKRLLPTMLTEVEKRVLARKRKKSKKSKSNSVIKGNTKGKVDSKTNTTTHSGENIVENIIDIRVLEFYKITLNSITTGQHSYSQYSKLVSNLDPELARVLKEASKRLSRKASGVLKEALEHFNFEILSFRSGFSFNNFDEESDLLNDFFTSLLDDDEEETDNRGNKPFFPFAKKKGGFNPFGASGDLPPDFDINSIPKPFLKLLGNNLKSLLNTPAGRDFKRLIDEALEEFEYLIDKHGLRGKSDIELKIAKKKLCNDSEISLPIALINACYKEEAKAKLSREARIVFLE